MLEKKQEEVQNFSEKGANINFQCKGLPAVKMLSTSKIVHVEPHDTAGSLTQSGLNSWEHLFKIQKRNQNVIKCN